MNAHISDTAAELHAVFMHVDATMRDPLNAQKLTSHGYTPEMHAVFARQSKDPSARGTLNILTSLKQYYSQSITSMEVERGNAHLAKAEFEKKSGASQIFDISAQQQASEADNKVTHLRNTLQVYQTILKKIDGLLNPTPPAPVSNVITLRPRKR